MAQAAVERAHHAVRRRRVGGRLLALATAASVACAPRSAPAPLGEPWGTTVRAIQADPTQAQGRLVTVSGEVGRIFGPRWFSIGGAGFDGGEELLVVGSSRLPALVDDLADSGRILDDIVQVTGRVRPFEPRAIEQELGTVLQGDWWRPFEGRPVLVITGLAVTSRADVPPAALAPIDVPEPAAPILDVDAILDARDPAALAGRPVALLGVAVRSAGGRSTLWVGPADDRRLFVALAPAPAIPLELRPGQTVVLAGVLRTVPADPATARSVWGLDAAEAAALARTSVYLRANGVRVVGDEPPRDAVVFPSRARGAARPR